MCDAGGERGGGALGETSAKEHAVRKKCATEIIFPDFSAGRVS